MNISFENISFIGLFISLTVTLIGHVIYVRYDRPEFLRLAWFWAALGFCVGIYSFFETGKTFILLSVVGQVWFYMASANLMDKNPSERWKKLSFLAGGFLTLILGYFNYSYIISALPISLVTGLLGLNLVKKSYPQTEKMKGGNLLKISHAIVGVIFATLLFSPLIGQITSSILVLLFVPLSILTVSGLLSNMFTREEDELSNELYDRNRRLIGTSKFAELGMMSAGIAHEINNPLAIIQARASQLLRIYNDPEKKEDLLAGLNQILNTSDRIGQTIQGIREFVHGEENIGVREVNLRSLVEDVLAFTGQRMINHGVNLRLYGLEHYIVIGNKVQLEQVILNLLNNSFDAIEFLPDKWIEMSVKPHSDKIQLFIKDSGSGIPQEVAAHIMEPFFSTKPVEKGTGLGLSLSSGIIEKLGGSLEYLSTESHTTFKLDIPGRPDQDWGIPLH